MDATSDASGSDNVQGDSQAATRSATLARLRRELDHVDQELLRTNFRCYKDVLVQLIDDKGREATNKLYDLGLIQKDEHVLSDPFQASSALVDLIMKKDCFEMYSLLDILKNDLQGPNMVNLFAPLKMNSLADKQQLQEEEEQSQQGSDVLETTSSSPMTEVAGAKVETSISFFLKELPGIIKDIDKTVGISSYYLRSDDCLVVHLKEAADAETLEKCFDEFRNRLPAGLNFIVDAKPAVANFSYTVNSGGLQSLGMFVEINAVAYWVSTAHGFFNENKEIEPKYDGRLESIDIHVGRREAVLFELPEKRKLIEAVRMPTPYVCFDMSKENGYLEDIALGPLTVPPDQLKADGGFFFERHDLENVKFYKAKLFCTATEPLSEKPRHVCQQLPRGSKVVSYSTYDSQALVGVLSKIGAQKLKSKTSGSVKYHFKPFYVIVNAGSVKPIQGHSGSVWAIPSGKGGRYKALAMTNAIVSDDSGGIYWLATPLCCLLDSLKRTFCNVFASSSQFDGVGFFLHEKHCKRNS